jgi:plastocyanin
MRKLAWFAAVAIAAIGCQDSPNAPVAQKEPDIALSAGGGGGISNTADVEFGTDEEKNPHKSEHAADKIRPHTVVIAAGGSVTYEIYPEHQPAVYQAGTDPDDIDTSQIEPVPGFPGLFRITDANGRIALAPDQSDEEKEWTTPPGTFDQPGKYLVICTTLPHFVENNMYSYVIVK